jgi:hypothetical protein
MLSEVFWVAFVTTTTGFLLKIVSFCYKSKCTEYNFCCIKIKRDPAAELAEDELERVNESRGGDGNRGA